MSDERNSGVRDNAIATDDPRWSSGYLDYPVRGDVRLCVSSRPRDLKRDQWSWCLYVDTEVDGEAIVEGVVIAVSKEKAEKLARQAARKHLYDLADRLSGWGYNPDIVSPPGETLLEAVRERGMTDSEFARKIGTSLEKLQELYSGKMEIHDNWAHEFAWALGIPAHFWRNRECQYRAWLKSKKRKP